MEFDINKHLTPQDIYCLSLFTKILIAFERAQSLIFAFFYSLFCENDKGLFMQVECYVTT